MTSNHLKRVHTFRNPFNRRISISINTRISETSILSLRKPNLWICTRLIFSPQITLIAIIVVPEIRYLISRDIDLLNIYHVNLGEN